MTENNDFTGAVILAIGSELTDGQIINKNAAWLSQKLMDIGIRTRLHLTVPDQRDLIQKSLNFISQENQFIFVTGGLGPTSDDFTREEVATWLNRKLIFDEKSWQHIHDRLVPRGYTVKEIQRQQAYFPEGATILINRQGTANGFFVDAHLNQKVFVLPGPPREIASIWEDSLHAYLSNSYSNPNPLIIKKWDTLGVGESDVAVVVEEILKSFQSELEIGYRVHLPYVEVKVGFLKDNEVKYLPTLNKLDEALDKITYSRDGFLIDDVFTKYLSQISRFNFETRGPIEFRSQYDYLQTRVQTLSKTISSRSSHKETVSEGLFWIEATQAHFFKVGCQLDQWICETEMVSNYQSSLMTERCWQLITEKAIYFWSQQLRNRLGIADR